jgi:XTP/dITP diphosphohydrolase
VAERRLLLATHNAHKLVELRRLLPGYELDGLPPGAPVPDETGSTYAENALIKAHAAVEATGRAAVADDSGVECEALGWRPGVHSARFAGPDATDEENLAKLEREAAPGARMRYVCVIAHVAPDGTEHLFEGVSEGHLAATRSGARGFGYDPVFVPDGAGGRTMADLTDAEKDAISHRGHAVRALAAWLDGAQ